MSKSASYTLIDHNGKRRLIFYNPAKSRQYWNAKPKKKGKPEPVLLYGLNTRKG